MTTEASGRPVEILLVEDNPGDARLIREMLKGSAAVRFELTHKERLGEALTCLTELPFDVLLLDLDLPDSQGLETVLQTISAVPKMPIIVLTGLDDDTLGMQAVEKGAQDYLVKGQINGHLLVRAILYASERHRLGEKLNRERSTLEQKVAERTKQLTKLNEQLQQEVKERMSAEKEIKRNASRLTTLLKLSEMGTATVQEIADFVLEEQVKLTTSMIGFLGFMDDAGETMQVHSWSKSVMKECRVINKPINFPLKKAGIWGEAIRQQKPFIANDYAAPNPHKKGYPNGHVELKRLMVVPVIDSGRVVTVAAVANKEHNYDPTDQHQLKLLVENMWEMIQRKNVEDALSQSEKQLQSLSSQLLTSQESERKRIVQELHDSVGQTLSALKYTVEHNLNQMGEEAGKSYVAALKDLIPKIQNAVEEVDRIGKGLRPSLLDDLGILPTISWFCREFQEVYSDIRIAKKITLQENEVPEHLKVVIYRILQESINNIAKHSRSDRVHISLGRKDRTLELSIRDNGRGFDVANALSPENREGGLGLISMIKRAELSGGCLTIMSDKETGTTIQASWPC
jgi:signal transduction histidine kinase